MTHTRRSLLSGAAGSILAAAQTPAQPLLRLPRKIKLGIIGFDGHVGDVLRPLSRLPDIELTAVADADTDPATLKSNLRNPMVAKAHRYATAAEMLARESLDVAAVCNNDGDRAGAILQCAERKLHVIAEKPLATARKDFEAVCAAVARQRIRLGTLLPMRFSPHYLAIKSIVDSGEVGEIAQIDGQKSYQLGEHRPEWQRHARTYGSTILWIGIHMIDLMTWTSSRRFTQAASFQSHVAFPEIGDMQNVTATIFRLDNGGTATLRMDYLRPGSVEGHGDDRLRLAGTKGIVEYQEATGVTVMSARGKRKLTDLPPQGWVFVDFLSDVYLGTKPLLSWKDIVQSNHFTLSAEEAAVTKKIVSIA